MGAMKTSGLCIGEKNVFSNSAEKAAAMPVFYFKVEIGSLGEIAFKEASGHDTETELIESRHGNSSAFSTIKMPGLKKHSDIQFRKGVFVKNNKISDWLNTINTNTIQRETVTIRLIDAEGNPTKTWKLNNAWPTKAMGVGLGSDGNEIVIEQLDMAHEG